VPVPAPVPAPDSLSAAMVGSAPPAANQTSISGGVSRWSRDRDRAAGSERAEAPMPDGSGPPASDADPTAVGVLLTIAGAGTGTVTSSPAGLACAGSEVSCAGWFAEGATVTLTATPAAGHAFTGWSGACSGTGPCALFIDGEKSVTATFAGPPTTTYYHTDVLGSVRATTDAAGATITRHDYFAFGESTSLMTGDPRRFLGQELDAETGFDHLGARQYRNVWGRFASVDPIFSPGAKTHPQLWNRYAYALNGPMRFSDPSGMEPQEPAPSAAEYGGANCTWSCQGFDDYIEFYFNASVSYGFTDWIWDDRRSVAAEEQAAKVEEQKRQIWQSAAFILWSAVLWAQSQGGQAEWEPTAFIIERGGTIFFRIADPTYTKGEWSGAKPVGAFAMIHVHRNTDPPSTGANFDNQTARKGKLDVYVISRYGLGRHSIDGSFDGGLRSDTSWMSGALSVLFPVRVW
jgi:RHS repeat-associated protein